MNRLTAHNSTDNFISHSGLNTKVGHLVSQGLRKSKERRATSSAFAKDRAQRDLEGWKHGSRYRLNVH